MRVMLVAVCLSLSLSDCSSNRSTMQTNDANAERLAVQWLEQVSFREADNPHAAAAPASQPSYADWIRRGEQIDGIATALQNLLKKGDERVDPAQVAYALGWLGDSRSTPVLVATLKNEDTYLRAEAAAALGRIGDSRAVKALCDSLKNDPSSNVRANAALAVSGFKSNEARLCLEAAAKRDASQFVRDMAAKALRQMHDVE